MKMTDADALVGRMIDVDHALEIVCKYCGVTSAMTRYIADDFAARLAADQQKGGGEVVDLSAALRKVRNRASKPETSAQHGEQFVSGMRCAANMLENMSIAKSVHTTPQPSSTAPAQQVDIQEAAARQLYSDYSGNHPTIHCNRFPAWEELTDKRRAEWLDKAVEADTGIPEVDRAIGRLMSSDPTFDDCNNAAALLRKLAHPPHADQETQ